MLTVLIGLVGLSIVVIVHEFGHFIAARAVGVEVETFSIGWGPRLFGFKRRGTEWRISAFPIGGFCKMKGEEDFKAALEKKLPYIPTEKGSFYGSSPWKRILILVAGPLFNVLFAVLLFSIVSLVGITVQTAPNRIVLASEVSVLSGTTEKNPADLAGLLTGDVVASIDGTPVRDYSDLQEMVGLNPGKQLNLVVERNSERIAAAVTPKLDKNSGQGLIGIYSWIEPRVESVDPQGSAAIAGIRKGDLIASINGKPIRNTVDIIATLSSKPETVTLSGLRDGQPFDARLVLTYSGQGQPLLGVAFETMTRTEKAASVAEAVANGGTETYKTFSMTAKGIGLLFSGVNVLKAVSGPARITYLVGSTATESIKASGISGIPTILSFLAFLSVSLFIMNLLPIPALDGGQIVLSVTEIVRRKPLPTKAIYRFQFIGAAMIMVLFFVATFSDILFFAGK